MPATSFAQAVGMFVRMGSIAAFLAVAPFCSTVTGQTPHSVTLTWTWSQGEDPIATGFNVKRGTTTGGPYAIIASLTDITVGTYTDTSGPGNILTPGTTYYYVVTAVSGNVESLASPEAAAAIPVSERQAPSPVTVFSPAQGATGISLTLALTWIAATGAASYDVYFGTSALPPFVVSTVGTSYSPAALNSNTTYYWSLVAHNAFASTASAIWSFTTAAFSQPAFFLGEDSLGGGVYYLQFQNNGLFGYYNYVASSIIYHFDMGYEAFIPSTGGQLYFYDFATGHWWYTSSSMFPNLYDFTLNAFIYYFQDAQNPGHYTTNPRIFSNLATGKIFTM